MRFSRWRGLAAGLFALCAVLSLIGASPAGVRSQEPVATSTPETLPPGELAPPAQTTAPQPVTVNPRYGVIYSRPLPPEQVAQHQRAFAAAGWLDMRADASAVPGKVPLLPLGAGSRLSGEALAALVGQYPPGTGWYIGGEANVPTQGNTSGAEYAPYFHEAAATIRSVDPTARIMAASVLNFVDTCRGCAGFTSGRAWMDEFRAAYLALYGSEPPVDVWAIDSYVLDWERLPMIDAAFLPRQLTALRAYLDAIPEHAGKPIWLTEFGVIWAYESMRWVEQDGVVGVVPARAFRRDLLEAWLRDTVAWLETEGLRMGVERWFLFASQAPEYETWYHGIELLEPNPEAQYDPAAPPHRLSALGEQYAAYARASAPVPAAPTEPGA
jgi:hypothetical protein